MNCPDCGAGMVICNDNGVAFWACERFSECKGGAVPAGPYRHCRGCSSRDGEHHFGHGCTLVERDEVRGWTE